MPVKHVAVQQEYAMHCRLIQAMHESVSLYSRLLKSPVLVRDSSYLA